MLRSLPSAVDDALSILYEPTAVFSQFLGSASVTFFFSFAFLASSSCLAFSCFPCLLFYFISFLVFSLPCLAFSFLSFIFFYFLCAVVRMRGDRYYVQYIRGSLSWVASGIVVFSRRE